MQYRFSKKTIKAERYGLGFLIKEFGIEVAQHHRAYSDAYAANVVFQKSLKNIPDYVISTEDLVKFAKPNTQKKKKKKFNIIFRLSICFALLSKTYCLF